MLLESWRGGRSSAEKIRESEDKIMVVEELLVLNFDKGEQRNYVGCATFLEMYDGFRLGKRLFLYHNIPEGMLYDEILGFSPLVLGGDVSGIEKRELR